VLQGAALTHTAASPSSTQEALVPQEASVVQVVLQTPYAQTRPALQSLLWVHA